MFEIAGKRISWELGAGHRKLGWALRTGNWEKENYNNIGKYVCKKNIYEIIQKKYVFKLG